MKKIIIYIFLIYGILNLSGCASVGRSAVPGESKITVFAERSWENTKDLSERTWENILEVDKWIKENMW